MIKLHHHHPGSLIIRRRQNASSSEEMGDLPREEHVLLRWQDCDGQTGSYFIIFLLYFLLLLLLILLLLLLLMVVVIILRSLSMNAQDHQTYDSLKLHRLLQFGLEMKGILFHF